MDVLDDDETKKSDSDTATTEKELLETVKEFYSALTTGNQDAIESIYSQSTSKEVSEVRHVFNYFSNELRYPVLHSTPVGHS